MDRKYIILIILSVIFIIILSFLIIYLLTRKRKKPRKKPFREYQVGGFVYPNDPWGKNWNISPFPLTYINVGDVYFDKRGIVDSSRIENNSFWAKVYKKKDIQIMLSISMGGVGKDDNWTTVLGSVDLYTVLANQIIININRYKAHGINFDWEPKGSIPINVRENFVYFCALLKSNKIWTGKAPLISIDITYAGNWKNIYNFSDLNPYLDKVEIMCYFSIFDQAIDQINNFGFDKEKVVLGMGLSSYSFSGVPPGNNPDCPAFDVVTNDWGQICPQEPTGQCKGEGKYPSWNAQRQYKWDFYVDLIRNGVGEYVLGKEGNFGRIPYIWFPGENETGSVLYWNGLDMIGKYVKYVRDNGYKGIFTWITSSDSKDATFTKALDQSLNKIDHGINFNDYPQAKCT